MDFKSRGRRAFSLVELVVVIFVIVVVISIVLPALGYARNAAKTADTRNQGTSLTQAIAVYKNDNNRLPGYFSRAEMGGSANATRGFTEMQNVMLDLNGGYDSTSSVLVGPVTDPARQVKYSNDAVGRKVPGGPNIYFPVSEKYLQKQNGTESGARLGVPEHADMKEYVDSFGTPWLLWMADDSAPGSVDSITANTGSPFVLDQYPAAPNGAKARFYWNSNRAFLDGGVFVGKQRKNQTTSSFLGGSAPDKLRALGAILGNPGSPVDIATTVQSPDIVPSAPRGNYVLMSAGSDGVYLERYGKGKRLVRASDSKLHYSANFRNPDDTPIKSNGQNSSIDIAADFDDVIFAGD